jgi:thioredoxin reductase (NADPH)
MCYLGMSAALKIRLRLDMPTIDPRNEQMFPKLSPWDIDRLRRFGQVRHYAAGEPLLVTGDIAPGLFVLTSGSVSVRRRDPLGHLAPIVPLRYGLAKARPLRSAKRLAERSAKGEPW